MSEAGEIIPAEGTIAINDGREGRRVRVENTSKRTIFVTSHYHFFEANKDLLFDRRQAYGMRLDVPAGTGVEWGPNETKEVELVAYGGRRAVFGFNGFVNGDLDRVDPDAALARLRSAGFQHTEDDHEA